MHRRSRLENDFPVYSEKFTPNPLFNILDQQHVTITLLVQPNDNSTSEISTRLVAKNRWSIASLANYLIKCKRGNGYNNTWHRDARSRLTETTGVETPRACAPASSRDRVIRAANVSEWNSRRLVLRDEFCSRKVYADIDFSIRWKCLTRFQYENGDTCVSLAQRRRNRVDARLAKAGGLFFESRKRRDNRTVWAPWSDCEPPRKEASVPSSGTRL